MNEPDILPGGEQFGSRLTVSQVTRLLKNLIEDSFPILAVEGELSNYVHHSSGHRYFTLKDASSQLRCVMFRWQAERLGFKPAEGMKLLAMGNLTVYEPGGQYQLTVVRLQPLGRGDLLARLEELKQRLAAEGLFARKRSLPPFPASIGVVTSPTGAAIRDIISILSRRSPHVRIIVRPALVQGAEAAADIVRAIDDLNRHTAADVLIVGRGGGSIEDLWCFNEEAVARAVAGSRIPVISAVGHETDFTLADFAADLRAPTPSAAAELAVRDSTELMQYLERCRMRLKQGMLARVDDLSARVESVRKGFSFERFMPQIAFRSQRVDELTLRLKSGCSLLLSSRETVFEKLKGRLLAMNPASVLTRGYAIVYRDRDDRIVTGSEMVDIGEGIRVALAEGMLRARVEEK
ncbi:MAG: exodeoxyribonuclease VII large subunit [Candidatus Latescibacterota bacterium]